MFDWLIHREPLPQASATLQSAASGAALATDAGSGWRLSASHGDAPALPVAQLAVRLGAGLAQPRHWYHVGTVVHAAPELKLFHRQSMLLMGSDLTGAAELSDLACLVPGLPEAAQRSALRALAQAALRELAEISEPDDGSESETDTASASASAPSPRLSPAPARLRVFAELPGLRNADGQSPFWQGLGQHFFPYTFAQAERRFGPGWVNEVAALMPRHPLLVSFLPEAAQAALSVVPDSHQAAAWALADAGLAPGLHVSLLDGGPVFETSLPLPSSGS
jgi:arginine N-succinyltransferase